MGTKASSDRDWPPTTVNACGQFVVRPRHSGVAGTQDRTLPSAEEVAVATMKEAASEFLANKRIAVTGVSRTPKGHGANVVYQR